MSASGSYGGFSASLQVDISKFKESTADTTKFNEETVKFTSGGPDMPEPIRLKLMPIYNAVEDSFFSVLDQQYQCKNLAQRKGNFKRVLREYPQINHVSEPRGMISHYALKKYLPVKYSNKIVRKALLVINVTGVHGPVMGHRSSVPGVTSTWVMRNESATRLIFRSCGAYSSHLAIWHLWSPHDKVGMSAWRLLARGDSLP